MSDRDNITLPREVVEKARKALTPMAYHTPPYERDEIAAILRKALAAEQPKPEDIEALRRDAEQGRWLRDWLDNNGLLVRAIRGESLAGYEHPDIEALRRDAERWQHWRDSHGFATIDHEGGRCFVTLICDCDDPDQVRAKRFAGEDSFEWLDAFTDAAMEGKR